MSDLEAVKTTLHKYREAMELQGKVIDLSEVSKKVVGTAFFCFLCLLNVLLYVFFKLPAIWPIVITDMLIAIFRVPLISALCKTLNSRKKNKNHNHITRANIKTQALAEEIREIFPAAIYLVDEELLTYVIQKMTGGATLEQSISRYFAEKKAESDRMNEIRKKRYHAVYERQEQERLAERASAASKSEGQYNGIFGSNGIGWSRNGPILEVLDGEFILGPGGKKLCKIMEGTYMDMNSMETYHYSESTGTIMTSRGGLSAVMDNIIVPVNEEAKNDFW